MNAWGWVGLAAVFVATATATATAGEAPKGGGVAQVLADIGPAPAIALTDQEGQPFALADLKGKAVLVSFVYTTCNGTCPATTTQLYRIQQALKKAGLWGRRVAFVSVTLDPARDSPGMLADYARVFGADPGSWRFLTGPPDRVADVHRAWGMWTKTLPDGTLDHPSRVFLVDPAGRQREIYHLQFLVPETVVGDVREVLGEAGGGG